MQNNNQDYNNLKLTDLIKKHSSYLQKAPEEEGDTLYCVANPNLNITSCYYPSALQERSFATQTEYYPGFSSLSEAIQFAKMITDKAQDLLGPFDQDKPLYYHYPAIYLVKCSDALKQTEKLLEFNVTGKWFPINPSEIQKTYSVIDHYDVASNQVYHAVKIEPAKQGEYLLKQDPAPRTAHDSCRII